jgi:hypothetical protein
MKASSNDDDSSDSQHIESPLYSKRTFEGGLLRKACLMKLTPQGAKDLIIFGQCFHLMSKATSPQRL